ncbi:MAG: metalloprotease [Candidatus Woesearchaeota archaeon]
MYMRNVTPRGLSFSKTEIDHLWKSWLAISIAFAIAMTGFNFLNAGFYLAIIISAFTVGIGFLMHELSHKFTAQYYRCHAEYRANFQMLFFALISSLFGIVFAAPGAVMIDGHINKKQYGIISLAGPLANIVLSLLFVLLGVFFSSGIISIVVFYGFSINTWLALFNLIPFGMFDGKKILNWDRKVYFIVVAAFFAVRIAGGFALGGGF